MKSYSIRGSRKLHKFYFYELEIENQNNRLGAAMDPELSHGGGPESFLKNLPLGGLNQLFHLEITPFPL